jgi:hypothetical protein
MPLFLFIFIFYNIHSVQSFNHIHTIHSPRPLSISSSLVAQWERPPCGAEPGIELGPAFQQADALQTEPRRTIINHAAPFIFTHVRVSVGILIHLSDTVEAADWARASYIWILNVYELISA